MARSSKMVRRRVEAAMRLRSSLKSDGAAVARSLEKRMAKVLEPGEKAPDIEHLLDVVGRMMVYEAKELEGSDEWRRGETWSLEELQREYRETVESFRQWFVGLRKQMRGLVGDEETRHLLDLDGRTPRSQEELAVYADQLYRRMPDWKMPELRYSVAASHMAWRKELEPMALKLRQLERRMLDQDSGRVGALVTRDEQLANVARDLRRAFRFCHLAYLLAGQDIMASRLEAGLDRELQSRTFTRPAETGKPTETAEPTESTETAGRPAPPNPEGDPAERRWWRGPVRWFGKRRTRDRGSDGDPAAADDSAED